MSSSVNSLSSEWESYLRFFLDHELEEAYELQPINRTVEENKSRFAPKPPEAVATLVAPAATTVTGAALRPENLKYFDLDLAISQAKDLIRSANDMTGLYKALDDFEAFPLKYEGARQRVSGRFANPESQTSDYLIIGDVPDTDEDSNGRVFSGKTGRLMDTILKALGIYDHSYLLPGLYWRPAGGRPATDEDVQLTAIFTQKAIELLRPQRVILLGATGARVTLNTTEGVQKLRGRRFDISCTDGHKIPAFASYHPSLVLTQPMAKGLLWRDLLRATAPSPKA
ncbi:MAG: uracil-DNA glycosylase [Asticcacaulis sp.]